MKKKRRGRLLALAMAMILSLTACGETQTDGGQALTERAYRSSFLDLESLERYSLAAAGLDGEEIFLVGVARQAKTGIARSALFRVTPEGTVRQLREKTEPDPDTSSIFESVALGPEGTVWILDRRFTRSEAGGTAGDDGRTVLLRQIDAAGGELRSADVTETVLSGGTDGAALDGQGNCYLLGGGKLTVLAPDGGTRFALEDESLLGGAPALLSDGNMGVLCRRAAGPAGEGDVYTVRTVDREKAAWGPAYELPSESPAGQYVALFGGSGDYLFYATIDQYLYGWNGETGRAERLLSWTRSNINPSGVSFCGMLPDSRPVAMAQTWTDWGVTDGLAVLTESDSLPERTVLTFAGMKISSDQWERIFRFNNLQTEYFIEARDYGDYSTASDLFGGITLLLTEIGAGKVPDILDTSNLPMRQLAAKGMLEDLWPYIDADPDLGRDRLMTHVLETDQVNGGLYEVFGQFTIDTVAGSRDAVGDRTAWTLEDLQAALDTMPAGCGIFSPYDTQEGTLLALLNYMEAQYVDWPAGTCSFDSDSFRSLLALCRMLPADFDWSAAPALDNVSARLREGRQMLLPYTLGLQGFDDVRVLESVFGSEVSFVGYPMADGSAGSCFDIWKEGLAISSQCADKAGAWSFVRQILLPPALSGELTEEERREELWLRFGSDAFPVNRELFELLKEFSMAPDRMTPTAAQAEAGLTEQDLWTHLSCEGEKVVVAAPMTQAEFDQLMELYHAVDSMDQTNRDIRTIILSQAAPYFAGDVTLDEAVRNIQLRAALYVSEQK